MATTPVHVRGPCGCVKDRRRTPRRSRAAKTRQIIARPKRASSASGEVRALPGWRCSSKRRFRKNLGARQESSSSQGRAQGNALGGCRIPGTKPDGRAATAVWRCARCIPNSDFSASIRKRSHTARARAPNVAKCCQECKERKQRECKRPRAADGVFRRRVCECVCSAATLSLHVPILLLLPTVRRYPHPRGPHTCCSDAGYGDVQKFVVAPTERPAPRLPPPRWSLMYLIQTRQRSNASGAG